MQIHELRKIIQRVLAEEAVVPNKWAANTGESAGEEDLERLGEADEPDVESGAEPVLNMTAPVDDSGEGSSDAAGASSTSVDGFYPYEIERGTDVHSYWYRSPGRPMGTEGDPFRPEDAAAYIGLKAPDIGTAGR